MQSYLNVSNVLVHLHFNIYGLHAMSGPKCTHMEGTDREVHEVPKLITNAGNFYVEALKR